MFWHVWTFSYYSTTTHRQTQSNMFFSHLNIFIWCHSEFSRCTSRNTQIHNRNDSVITIHRITVHSSTFTEEWQHNSWTESMVLHNSCVSNSDPRQWDQDGHLLEELKMEKPDNIPAAHGSGTAARVSEHTNTERLWITFFYELQFIASHRTTQ